MTRAAARPATRTKAERPARAALAAERPPARGAAGLSPRGTPGISAARAVGTRALARECPTTPVRLEMHRFRAQPAPPAAGEPEERPVEALLRPAAGEDRRAARIPPRPVCPTCRIARKRRAATAGRPRKPGPVKRIAPGVIGARGRLARGKASARRTRPERRQSVARARAGRVR
jgi:hypothetical protein